jgi:hypothetical protein
MLLPPSDDGPEAPPAACGVPELAANGR